jgi:hypothetical protein
MCNQNDKDKLDDIERLAELIVENSPDHKARNTCLEIIRILSELEIRQTV